MRLKWSSCFKIFITHSCEYSIVWKSLEKWMKKDPEVVRWVISDCFFRWPWMVYRTGTLRKTNLIFIIEVASWPFGWWLNSYLISSVLLVQWFVSTIVDYPNRNKTFCKFHHTRSLKITTIIIFWRYMSKKMLWDRSILFSPCSTYFLNKFIQNLKKVNTQFIKNLNLTHLIF